MIKNSMRTVVFSRLLCMVNSSKSVWISSPHSSSTQTQPDPLSSPAVSLHLHRPPTPQSLSLNSVTELLFPKILPLRTKIFPLHKIPYSCEGVHPLPSCNLHLLSSPQWPPPALVTPDSPSSEPQVATALASEVDTHTAEAPTYPLPSSINTPLVKPPPEQVPHIATI